MNANVASPTAAVIGAPVWKRKWAAAAPCDPTSSHRRVSKSASVSASAVIAEEKLGQHSAGVATRCRVPGSASAESTLRNVVWASSTGFAKPRAAAIGGGELVNFMW